MSMGEGTSAKVAGEGEDSITEELEETTDMLSLTTTGKWVDWSGLTRRRNT
jgi:hypothetical protein